MDACRAGKAGGKSSSTSSDELDEEDDSFARGGTRGGSGKDEVDAGYFLKILVVEEIAG